MLRGTRIDNAARLALPDLLRPDGILNSLRAAEFDAIERDTLLYWCHQNARYGLPTQELIDWLKDLIGTRAAIEIGSGAGDFAAHLGIRGTDNKMQTRPEIAAYYAALGQPVIRYPDWVERIDALDAVRKYRPAVVFASWVTHWIDPNGPVVPGNVLGVKEDLILAEDVTYVVLGNLAVHHVKPIMQRPHEELTLPFLRSRAAEPKLDRVFIWNR